MFFKIVKKILFKILKIVVIYPNKLKFFRKNKIDDYLIIKNNLSILEIKNLVNNEYKKNLTKIKNNTFLEKDNRKYAFDITKFYNEETIKKIEGHLKSKEFTSLISEKFNLKVSFDSFIIRLNIFNSDSPEEYGPKMWHRDNDSFFGQLKLFLVTNKLNEKDGGMFFFIPQLYLPGYLKLKSNYSHDENNFSKTDKNSRIKNKDVLNQKLLQNKTISFGLSNEEALILDTNDTYHKGGFIRSKEGFRVMVQAIYKTKYLFLSNYEKNYTNPLYKYTKIFFTGLKNRLRSEF